jgi:hypothetical protein
MQKTQPATAGRGHTIREVVVAVVVVAVIVALPAHPEAGNVQNVQYTDS